MGILIAIEGTDASGKQTQSELLHKRLAERGVKTRLVSFPAYESESSALVRMYLSGAFGSDPSDVNAYAASAFYAVDRFASYRTDWEKDYRSGTVIIADRYVPSNMIHQAAKLDDDAEKRRFLNWLVELEYGHFGLPVPGETIFLDMPSETAAKLMAERDNKITGSEAKDIHERNFEYLRRSRENALEIARDRRWRIVRCTNERHGLRSIEDIHSEIMSAACALISGGK